MSFFSFRELLLFSRSGAREDGGTAYLSGAPGPQTPWETPEVCTIVRFFSFDKKARSGRADRLRQIKKSVAQI